MIFCCIFLQKMEKCNSSSLVLVNGNSILLCYESRKQFPNGRKDQNHCIGGKVNEGEDPFLAACREFVEEVPFCFSPKKFSSELISALVFQNSIIVSKQKKLSHIFFFVDINLILKEELKEELLNIVETFRPERSDLISIFWYSLNDELENRTTLLDQCLSSFTKYLENDLK